MNSFRMTVFRRDGRKFWECQWVDPITEKKVTKSTGKTTEREARVFAGRKLAELEQGDYQKTDIAWSDFKSLFIEQHVNPMRLNSRNTVIATLNAIEEHISPAKLSRLTANAISDFATKLRATGITEASVKRHLSVVRTLLNWARRMRMIREVPHIAMPRRVGGMKGRDPSREELERMLDCTAAVVDKDRKQKGREKTNRAPSWKFLIEGLWWSGLRLDEAMNLHWTDDSKLSVDLGGKRPRFKIQADAEKGGKYRLLPMAPEFAMMLLAIPEEQRRGYVFNPEPYDNGPRLLSDWVSKVISQIGKKANVKVSAGNRHLSIRYRNMTHNDIG